MKTTKTRDRWGRFVGDSETELLIASTPETPFKLADAGDDFRTLVLVGDGETKYSDGDRAILDAKGAAAVIKEIRRKGVDLPIDVDHAGVYGPMRGFKAPAVGWIKRETVRYEPGRGLIADVEWTDEGAELLHSKQYRYLSHIVIRNKHTKRVHGLHSAGLTNKPLTLNAPALKAASEAFLKGAEMPENAVPDENAGAGPDLSMLVGRIIERMDLDVPTDAPVETVLTAILEKLKADSGDAEGSAEETAAASELRTIFKLKDDATLIDIAKAAKNTSDEMVLGSETVKTMQGELETLKASEHDRTVTAVLEKYTGSKINPNDVNQMKVCSEYAKRDPPGFDKFMEGQPDILPVAGSMMGAEPEKLDDRETIIASARKEFATGVDDDGNSLAGFSELKLVNLGLREAGLEPVTKDETGELKLAG